MPPEIWRGVKGGNELLKIALKPILSNDPPGFVEGKGSKVNPGPNPLPHPGVISMVPLPSVWVGLYLPRRRP